MAGSRLLLSMKRVLLLSSILSLLAFWPVSAQNREQMRERVDSILFPEPVGESILFFQTRQLNLGKVMDDAGKIAREFPFRNQGKEAVTIVAAHTSCSCLEVFFERNRILPGEKGKVTLVFDPHKFTGKVEVKAMIYTDFSGRKPSNQLSMTADVCLSDEWRHLPYKVGNLRLKRKAIEFSEVSTSNYRKERILCANAGNQPMRVSASLLPDYARLYTDPEVILPGQEADLWIGIDGKKISRKRDRSRPVRFNLLLDGTGGSRASRMLEVVVLPLEKPEHPQGR